MQKEIRSVYRYPRGGPKARRFGRPRARVLRAAPVHSTLALYRSAFTTSRAKDGPTPRALAPTSRQADPAQARERGHAFPAPSG